MKPSGGPQAGAGGGKGEAGTNSNQDERSDLVHTVARGLVFKFGSMGTVKAITLLYNLMLLRMLPPVEAGLFFLANNMIAFFADTMGMGLPAAILRYAPMYGAQSKEKLKIMVWTLMVTSIAVALLFAAGMIILSSQIAQWYGKPIAPIIPWVAGLSALYLMFGFWTTMLDSFKEFEHSAIVSIVLQFLRVTLTAAALFWVGRLAETAFQAYFVSLALVIAYLGWYARNWLLSLPGKLAYSIHDAWECFCFGIQVYVSSAADTIAANMDVILLGYFQPLELVAAYSAIIIFVRNIAPFVILPVRLVQQPLLVEQHTNKTGLFAPMVRELSRWTMYLGVPMLGVFVLFAPAILSILTPQYVSSGNLIWFFIPMVLAALLSSSSRNALFAAGHARALMAVSVTILATNFIFNWTLIPQFGMTGSAIGTSLALVIGESLAVWLAWRRLKAALHPDILRALLAGIAMVVFGFIPLPILGTTLAAWSTTGLISLAIGMAISGVVYMLALFVAGGLNAEDWKMARNVMGRYVPIGRADN